MNSFFAATRHIFEDLFNETISERLQMQYRYVCLLFLISALLNLAKQSSFAI